MEYALGYAHFLKQNIGELHVDFDIAFHCKRTNSSLIFLCQNFFLIHGSDNSILYQIF